MSSPKIRESLRPTEDFPQNENHNSAHTQHAVHPYYSTA